MTTKRHRSKTRHLLEGKLENYTPETGLAKVPKFSLIVFAQLLNRCSLFETVVILETELLKYEICINGNKSLNDLLLEIQKFSFDVYHLLKVCLNCHVAGVNWNYPKLALDITNVDCVGGIQFETDLSRWMLIRLLRDLPAYKVNFTRKQRQQCSAKHLKFFT